MTSLQISLTTETAEMATRTLHESFCVYRKQMDQAGIDLEAAVASKFEELESRIDSLEKEVRRLSSGKPHPPSLPRSARREEKHSTQPRRWVGQCYDPIVATGSETQTDWPVFTGEWQNQFQTHNLETVLSIKDTVSIPSGLLVFLVLCFWTEW